MQFMWSLMRTCVHAVHVVFDNRHEMLLRSKKKISLYSVLKKKNVF